MPRRRLPDPFYLVVIDEDKRQLTVEGPMQDDTAWNTCVCDAQDQGRHVAALLCVGLAPRLLP